MRLARQAVDVALVRDSGCCSCLVEGRGDARGHCLSRGHRSGVDRSGLCVGDVFRSSLSEYNGADKFEQMCASRSLCPRRLLSIRNSTNDNNKYSRRGPWT